MNIFSEDCFSHAFGQAHFPDQSMTSELFELEGKFWRLPSLNFRQPITDSIMIDFFEPFSESVDDKLLITQLSSKAVQYLPRVSQKMMSCSEWLEQNLDRRFEAAPTVIWSNFESWNAFVDYVRQKRSNIFSDSLRRQRKLEKELGPIQFILDDRRPEVLETCFHWKSEQWRRQGLPDRFANPGHVRLFRELAARQILLVSSLGTEKHLVAIHIGMLHKGRLYSWVPAYASAYSHCSPGRLLFHFLLEASFKLQHQEFDFLLGGEDYKWSYATHVRLIEEIGRRPLSKQLKHSLKDTLTPFPGVTAVLKQLRNKVLPPS